MSELILHPKLWEAMDTRVKELEMRLMEVSKLSQERLEAIRRIARLTHEAEVAFECNAILGEHGDLVG